MSDGVTQQENECLDIFWSGYGAGYNDALSDVVNGEVPNPNPHEERSADVKTEDTPPEFRDAWEEYTDPDDGA